MPPAREQVAALDEEGCDALWLAEAHGSEAFTAAALYLRAGRRMAVATGIASIHGRDAVAANAAGRLLEAMHPSRVVLRLGVRHAPLVEPMLGPTPLTAPVDHWTRLAPAVASLRG